MTGSSLSPCAHSIPSAAQKAAYSAALISWLTANRAFTTTSSGTFVLAIISAIRATSIVRTELKARHLDAADTEPTGRREAVVQL